MNIPTLMTDEELVKNIIKLYATIRDGDNTVVKEFLKLCKEYEKRYEEVHGSINSNIG